MIRNKLVASMAAVALVAACKDGGDGGGPEPKACVYQTDCEGGKCVDGKCATATSCSREAGGPAECGEYEVCEQDRCIPICATDLNCPADGYCYSGVCRRYTAVFDKPEPNAGNTEKSPLKAGVGIEPLDFPIGVSMAGYGARMGPVTPYADQLGGSTGVYDRPVAYALCLDNNVERILIIRIALGWSTDFILTKIALNLQERTGYNYLHKIITSATHTHSFPARFWDVLPNSPYGVFGYDNFMLEIFTRDTESFTRAALKAIDNLEDAKFGYAVNEDFDPDDTITADRRDETPVYKDDRMTLMRFDRSNGDPLAILVNFGMHGTHLDGTYVAGDAPGGVEAAGRQLFEKKLGKPVPVVFMQGNAGDITPTGEDMGHPDVESVQLIGYRVFEKMTDLYDGIQTTSDVDLAIVDKWLAFDKQILEYQDDEFYDKGGLDKGKPYKYGAFQCVISSDDDYSTKHEDGKIGCLLSSQRVNKGRPIPNFMKTHLSALKLNGLVIMTLPGEPESKLGRDAAVEAKSRGGFDDAITFGYSQDHHTYLVTEDSWWQGGYEPSMTIWGWKFGPFIQQSAIDLAVQLSTPEKEDNSSDVKPTFLEFFEDDAVQPTATPAGEAGRTVAAPPAKVKRFDIVAFRWKGGHPGVDLPGITMEKKAGDSFVELLTDAGTVYDELYGFNFVTDYLGDYQSDHTWELRWEDREDFPTGTFRFHVRGKYFNGSAAADYEAGEDDAFEVAPSDGIEIREINLNGSEVSGEIAYPAQPCRPPQGNDSRMETLGHLMRSQFAPPYVGGPLDETLPVNVTVRIEKVGGGGGDSETLNLTALNAVDWRDVNVENFGIDGSGNSYSHAFRAKVSGFSTGQTVTARAGAGDYKVTITAEDSFGNTGSGERTVGVE